MPVGALGLESQSGTAGHDSDSAGGSVWLGTPSLRLRCSRFSRMEVEQQLHLEVPWGLQAMQMPTRKEQAALFAQLDFNGACGERTWAGASTVPGRC